MKLCKIHKHGGFFSINLATYWLFDDCMVNNNSFDEWDIFTHFIKAICKLSIDTLSIFGFTNTIITIGQYNMICSMSKQEFIMKEGIIV